MVGLASLAIVLGCKRFAPAVPGSLVAVLFGIVLVAIFNLDEHGVEIVGHIKSGLPSFGVPHLPFKDFVKLLGSGVGVMLVGFAEGLGAAETYAARAGARRANIAFVDVTAVSMLDQVAHELQQHGVRFLLARDVGQVRDVLRGAGADPALQRVFLTVQDAVDAASRAPETRRG